MFRGILPLIGSASDGGECFCERWLVSRLDIARAVNRNVLSGSLYYNWFAHHCDTRTDCHLIIGYQPTTLTIHMITRLFFLFLPLLFFLLLKA